MEPLLLAQLFKKAKNLAKRSDLDANLLLITGLVGSLVLISVIITLLVWLRYLVAVGLVTASVAAGIRWRREGNMALKWNGKEDNLPVPALD